MPAHPPLLSRLRRRLRGIGVLFALLLVGKLVVGGLCYGDGLRASAVVEPAVASALHEAYPAASMLAATSDHDDGECWHAGAGGCHCNCVHAAPVLMENAVAIAMPHPMHISPAMIEAAGLPSPFVPLRPPIA